MKSAASKDTCGIFGIPVAKTTMPQAVDRITELVKRGKTEGGPAASIVTVNVDFIANAVPCGPFKGDAELWGYLKKADLAVADGMPVVLLSRLLRNPLPERVTGADLVPELCARFAKEGLSIYILGGSREAAEAALAKLPPVKTAGMDFPQIDLSRPQPEIVERINAAAPDLLFVALGNPKQELWMGRNAAALRIPAMMGVGGTFNFISGRVRRAPRWVQRGGMEWIYRIIQEPRRLWRRYAYGMVKFAWLSVCALCGGFRK